MWLRPNFLGEKRVRKNPQRLPAGHLHLMNHGEDPAQRLSKARALPQPHSAIQRSVLHVDAIHRLVEPLHAQSIRSALSETLSASVESRWICSVDSLPFLPTKTCGYTSNECMFEATNSPRSATSTKRGRVQFLRAWLFQPCRPQRATEIFEPSPCFRDGDVSR